MLRHRQIGLLATLILVSALLTGCGVQSVPESAIPGTYEITYEPYSGTVLATERLVLKADGTFEQTFTPTRSKPWSNKGRWSMDKMWGDSGICLHDYMDGLDPSSSIRVSSHPKRSNLFTSVNYGYGTITITVNDDLDYHLRKVK